MSRHRRPRLVLRRRPLILTPRGELAAVILFWLLVVLAMMAGNALTGGGLT